MAISRPLTKPLLKKMFLKTLHESRRPGGKLMGNGWSVGQILGSSIQYIFQVEPLSEYEIALGRRAVYELFHDEYLWPDRSQSQGQTEFLELTPKGLKAVERDLDQMQIPTIDIDQVLTSGALREKVRDDFISGEYEAAILKAFKLLEVAVRTKAGLSANEHGRDLFVKALNKNNPLLKHPEAQTSAEMESLFFLMIGAYGWFRNPASHRTVAYGDAPQAAQVLAFAELLLSLIDQCTV